MTVTVGIAGLGTVGSEVCRQLIDNHSDRFSVTAVSARNKDKERNLKLPDFCQWVDNPADMANSACDIIVELMGGEDDPARSLIQNSLKSGKSVVTANKALLAEHGLSLPQDNLYWEAAVAGAVPIIKTLQDSLSGDKVNSVHGILNGTCNFILTKMLMQKRDFDDVLKEAQNLGFAEADPTLDIDGYDAAHKLVLLSRLAFKNNARLEDVELKGIREITLGDHLDAAKEEQVIRLVGSATKDEMSVCPVHVPFSHPLASVMGPLNAVMIDAELAGPITITGQGAGAQPTASAVLGDIMCASRRFA